MTRSTRLLTHNRVELALHEVRAGEGRPLLLLHGLGDTSPADAPYFTSAWPGPVMALDFTGHGESTIPRGGGYTAEILMGDGDAAIAELGEVCIVGRGLGAYIGLLIAGARPSRVHGVVLADGPGLSGGPSVPTSQPVVAQTSEHKPPDPHALLELGRDLRPPDYATAFVRLAMQSSPLDQPVTVVARFRPAWLEAVVAEPGVAEAGSIAEALDRYRA